MNKLVIRLILGCLSIAVIMSSCTSETFSSSDNTGYEKGPVIEDPAGETPVFHQVDISAEEAQKIIEMNRDNPDFVILDVRSVGEFESGRIENAVNIDILSDSFRDEAGNLDQNKTYLVYCRSGNRSRTAIAIMKELGFTSIVHLAGGITDWYTAGLPVIR